MDKAFPDEMSQKEYGEVKVPYLQESVTDRIRALFLDNIGKILTGDQIKEAARNPKTGEDPENWHQRLSELRTDEGYTILSRRNRGELKISEYLMPTAERRQIAKKRLKIDSETWKNVLQRANYKCEWLDEDTICGLREGDIDPVGGGRVRLTPDHKKPHALDPNSDPKNPNDWQALCGRHQVVKKNYWDDTTGKLNVYAIVQSASEDEKMEIYQFLKKYFEKKESEKA